jgi:hypothetical protein
MKTPALLIGILLLALLVVPLASADAEPDATREIIRGVTLEPVPETPTEVVTMVTREPTEPPTAEPSEIPVTMHTEKEVTTPEPPAPQVGWLTILSTPSQAEVSVDGNPAGVTPITGRELGAGTHAIRITMAGYEPYQIDKEIRAGEQAAVDATLNPVPVPTVPTTRATTRITEVPTPCLGCDKGWIRVNCNVDGATVSFDYQSPACTISGGSCDTEVGTTSTPFRTFNVQKPGYGIFTGAVTSWPAQGETVNLYATLNPEPTPAYGTIQVVSHPSGAIVTLDGTSWQYTPATFTSVGAGTSHYLRITMSGYQQYSTSAYVTAGEISAVNAYLVPNNPYPGTGSLNIVTSPGGADIYVDGNYIAESPFVVTNLAPGSHLLRLHKAGYDEYLAPVTIVSGRQTPISYTFASQPTTVGSIEVASTPAGSSLTLDGNYMGQIVQGSYFDLTSIPQGYHTLFIRLTDYQDYTQTVYVKGGQIVTVNALLTPNGPSPTPDTTGELLVVSSPAGAELLLDNTFRGITPVTLSDIPAGPHVVIARLAGYADAQQAVTVTGGQSTPVALTLAEIPATTRTPMSVLPVLGAVALAGAIFIAGCRKK